MNSLKPSLTEPGMRYFLNQTLQQCYHFKRKHYDTLVNLGLFVLFCVVLGAILVCKYKGALTPEEQEAKDLEKKQYILSKIRNFQEARQRAQQELITGLPHWERF